MGKGKKREKRGLVRQQTNDSTHTLSWVTPPHELDDTYLKISFRYFINEYIQSKRFNNCFKDSKHCSEFMHNAHLLLMELSNKSKNEVLNSGYKSQMHMHPLEGDALSIFMGIAGQLTSQLETSSFYQIKTNSVADGRVVFYLKGNTIYVLLYDPNHLFYPDQKHGSKQALKHSYSPS